MDIELEPGIDFVDRITHVVGACHVLLVIVGPRWATLSNGEDRARISNEEDFVRLEVETALRRPEVRVIPLLVDGARMPYSDELPEPVRALTRRNALELSDTRWRYDVGRLMETLEELLAGTYTPVPPAREPFDERMGRAARVEPAATAVAEPTDAPETKRFERGKRFARGEGTAPPPPPTDRPTRRWLVVAAGAAIAVAVAALVIAGVLGGGDDDAGQDEEPIPSPRLSATVIVGGAPDGMAVDEGLVWVTDQEENVVRRVDAATNEPLGPPIPVGRNPDGVAAADGTIWVASIDDGSVTRLDTRADGTVTNTSAVDLDGRPEGVSLGKQLVWVTTGPTGDVARLDRASATAVGDPIDVGLNAVGVFVGEDNVYVLTVDGLVLSYRVEATDDGFDGEEGTFTVCSFWLVSALAEIGEIERARTLCEKLLSYASPLLLYAKEIEPHSGRHLGNFPQAFTHLALINAVMHIVKADQVVTEGAGEPEPPVLDLSLDPRITWRL